MAKTTRSEQEAGGCVKVVLFLLAVGMVFLIPLTLVTFNIGRVIFSPDIVSRVASDVIVESDIVPLGLEWFSEWRADQRVIEGTARPNETEPDIVQLLSFLRANHWEGIQEEVLLDEFLISWTHATIDGVYEWIDNDEELPQVTLNMKDFKSQVKTEHGNNAVMIAYTALPPCTEEQIEDMLYRLSLVPVGTEVLYNLCAFPDEPPEYFGTDQRGDYYASLQEVVENLPDDYEIVARMAEDEITLMEGVTPQRVKTILRWIRFMLRWSIILPVLGLLLMVLFVSRMRKPGLWLGVTLVGGGILGLIFTLLYRVAITTTLAMFPLRTVPPAVLEEGSLFLLGLAREMFGLMLIMAGAITVLGLAAFFIRRSTTGEEADEEIGLVGGPAAPPASTAAPTVVRPAAKDTVVSGAGDKTIETPPGEQHDTPTTPD